MSKPFCRKDRTKMLADYLRVKRENAGLRESNNESIKTIDQLKQRLQHTSNQLQEALGKIMGYECHHTAIAQMIGDCAIGLGVPVSINLPINDSDKISLPVKPKPMSDFADDSSFDWRTETIRHEVLHLLKVEAIRDRMSGALHCRVKLNGMAMQYAISEYALKKTPVDFLTKRISEEMSIALVEAIRNPKLY